MTDAKDVTAGEGGSYQPPELLLIDPDVLATTPPPPPPSELSAATDSSAVPAQPVVSPKEIALVVRDTPASNAPSGGAQNDSKAQKPGRSGPQRGKKQAKGNGDKDRSNCQISGESWAAQLRVAPGFAASVMAAGPAGAGPGGQAVRVTEDTCLSACGAALVPHVFTHQHAEVRPSASGYREFRPHIEAGDFTRFSTSSYGDGETGFAQVLVVDDHGHTALVRGGTMLVPTRAHTLALSQLDAPLFPFGCCAPSRDPKGGDCRARCYRCGARGLFVLSMYLFAAKSLLSAAVTIPAFFNASQLQSEFGAYSRDELRTILAFTVIRLVTTLCGLYVSARDSGETYRQRTTLLGAVQTICDAAVTVCNVRILAQLQAAGIVDDWEAVIGRSPTSYVASLYTSLVLSASMPVFSILASAAVRLNPDPVSRLLEVSVVLQTCAVGGALRASYDAFHSELLSLDPSRAHSAYVGATLSFVAISVSTAVMNAIFDDAVGRIHYAPKDCETWCNDCGDGDEPWAKRLEILCCVCCTEDNRDRYCDNFEWTPWALNAAVIGTPLIGLIASALVLSGGGVTVASASAFHGAVLLWLISSVVALGGAMFICCCFALMSSFDADH